MSSRYVYETFLRYNLSVFLRYDQETSQDQLRTRLKM